jgi:hypothetical protein
MAQAQVVQATCPGCKTVLRIPSDWLRQPIKCKNCGTIMQARGPVTAVPTPPPVAALPPRQATPAPRKSPPPVPAVPAPVAPSLRPPSTPSFDFDGEQSAFDSPVAPSSRLRPRKKGKPWLGVAILGGMVLSLGIGAFVFKDKLRAGFQTAVTGKVPDDDEPGPGPKSGTSPGTGTGGKGPPKVTPGGSLFPRRALIISVHNYLYANPIFDAPEIPNVDSPPNINRLISSLNRGLNIPLTQIVQISDQAKKSPVPPLRMVIEEGLVNFLKTCRKQDRIMVFFIGHTKEVNDQSYLVPLEGEFENVETLIPLKWVYDQLAKCEARQKILVIDGNRFNAAQGEERPSAGPLDPKFQAALQAPPAGVQVWSACSAGQLSQEFEESSLGAFLDSLRLALTPEKGMKGALEGRIQKPDDEIPVQVLFNKTNAIMAEQVGKRKLKQVALLAGAAPATGAEFDATEKPAPLPAMPVVRTGDARLVKEIMSDISLPPLKGGEGNGSDVVFTQLPPFPEAALEPFKGGALPADSNVRKTVNEARVTLWAISTASVPGDIKPEVDEVRKKLKVDLSVMRDRYTNPGAAGDVAFKARVTEDSRKIAIIIARLGRKLEDLTTDEIKAEVKDAPKRWQANYDFLVARFNAELAYLEEYSGLLGQILKAYPEPFDEKVNTGWKMAAKQKASDAAGKKFDKAARAQFAKIAEKFPNTPWAVLSKRENLTALGLDWQAY